MLKFLREFLKHCGLRAVTCPETSGRATVCVDPLFAAMSDGALRLSSCSRWPERVGCDHACLTQIAAARNSGPLLSTVTCELESRGSKPVAAPNNAVY